MMWMCFGSWRTFRCCCNWWGISSWISICLSSRLYKCHSIQRLALFPGCLRWRTEPSWVWTSSSCPLRRWSFSKICRPPSASCQKSIRPVCSLRTFCWISYGSKSKCRECCHKARGIFWLKSCVKKLWKSTWLPSWLFLQNGAKLMKSCLIFCFWTHSTVRDPWRNPWINFTYECCY